MGFYREQILPHLVHLSMRQSTLAPYRERVVSSAGGRVLEIGIGSGLNLPLYSRTVTQVVGLDPSPKLLSMAHDAKDRTCRSAELIEAVAEAIPIETRSIDTVVTTWTLCTIPDVMRALDEMRRVLKATGRLVFVEHGRSSDVGVRRWQDRLNPCWKPIAGGCHLNRPIAELIERSGFRIERLDTGYAKGPKPMTFMYEGIARPG
jgi:ubiquinone/menaquinone biosynthesis C-methylase UbiE